MIDFNRRSNLEEICAGFGFLFLQEPEAEVPTWRRIEGEIRGNEILATMCREVFGSVLFDAFVSGRSIKILAMRSAEAPVKNPPESGFIFVVRLIAFRSTGDRRVSYTLRIKGVE